MLFIDRVLQCLSDLSPPTFPHAYCGPALLAFFLPFLALAKCVSTYVPLLGALCLQLAMCLLLLILRSRICWDLLRETLVFISNVHYNGNPS
jgi:hypothetical protein